MSIGDLLSRLFTEGGPGGLIVITVISFAMVTYVILIHWIVSGGNEEDSDQDIYLQ